MIRYHTVRPGETLEGLAKKYYGDRKLAMFIYKHNEQYIRDPNVIYPGQKIIIPHAWEPAAHELEHLLLGDL